MMDCGMGSLWGLGWMGSIGPIAAWLVVIAAVAIVARYAFAGRGARKAQALQILEERYARGEIEQEEFLWRRADLGGGARPA